MSYSIGDIVKFNKDIPHHGINKNDEAELVVNIVFTTSWLLQLSGKTQQLYFMESDFDLVRSKPSLYGALPPNPNTITAPNTPLGNIYANLKAGVYGGVSISSPGTWKINNPSDFKVGDIVKFNGSDEPVLKTGMHLEIQELRPDGDFNCTIVGQNRMLPILVMRKEIVRINNSTVTNSVAPAHICAWKVYTGLSYREDYCDCGLTKNKRGLYE